jgi:pyruvate dehydrogenase E2 component (dihydrolipoamide acetyltransferase)
VIKDVANKSILQLAKEIQEVVERARAKKLTKEDLSDGTITITNAGSIGGLFATPVINFPEVAILGLNKIAPKPVVKDGQIVIRDWTYFSISLDHRIVDGAIAAEFMKDFIRYIENPSLLLLEA